MRKLIILCALVMTTCQLCAQESTIRHMQAKGLPKQAIPANYFFKHLYDSPEQLQQFGNGDIAECAVTTPDAAGLYDETEQFVFVVEQPLKAGQDFKYIDIWVFDGDSDRAYRAFHQTENNFGKYMAINIHILCDVTSRDSVYTVNDTKERVTRHLKTGRPVVALTMQEYTGTVHGIISTLIVQCATGATKLLEGESTVAVLSPLNNMLMMPEWNVVQNYLLTTSSAVSSVSPYKESEDFTIFNHINFTPTLHIYTPKGEIIKSIELPTDKIDMVR